jgi:hypothetical protein
MNRQTAVQAVSFAVNEAVKQMGMPCNIKTVVKSQRRNNTELPQALKELQVSLISTLD